MTTWLKRMTWRGGLGRSETNPFEMSPLEKRFEQKYPTAKRLFFVVGKILFVVFTIFLGGGVASTVVGWIAISDGGPLIDRNFLDALASITGMAVVSIFWLVHWISKYTRSKP